jgi:hypothetical protein
LKKNEAFKSISIPLAKKFVNADEMLVILISKILNAYIKM